MRDAAVHEHRGDHSRVVGHGVYEAEDAGRELHSAPGFGSPQDFTGDETEIADRPRQRVLSEAPALDEQPDEPIGNDERDRDDRGALGGVLILVGKH